MVSGKDGERDMIGHYDILENLQVRAKTGEIKNLAFDNLSDRRVTDARPYSDTGDD